MKHDGDTVDDVPAASEQVFNHGVEARAVGVVGVDFKNHQAAGEHGKPECTATRP